MWFESNSNVLLLVTAYAILYGCCEPQSLVQWFYRANTVVLAAVMYVLQNNQFSFHNVVVPILLVSVFADTCDHHTDAVSALHRTLVITVIAQVHGFAQTQWVVSSTMSLAFLVLHSIAQQPSPGTNALAMYCALTMGKHVDFVEAFARCFGACGILCVHKKMHVPLQAYSVVHFFIAPWPVTCAIAMFQILKQCYRIDYSRVRIFVEETVLV